MPIVRIIHVTFPPEQAAKAETNWKDCCAPIMLRQPGCKSEELLRCRENPGDYISYSEWEDEASIQRYLRSEDHQEIKRHNRNIEGAKVEVLHYDFVR